MDNLMHAEANSTAMNSESHPEILILEDGLNSSYLDTVLIGTLISIKEVNRGVIINILKLAWASFGEFQMSNLKKHTFMFVFKDRKGAEKA